MNPRAPSGTKGEFNLPYFDVLIELIDQGHPVLTTAFGVNVHWGYWGADDRSDGSTADFARAAERLNRRVCDLAGVRDGHRVLDVGCGWGGTLASLNARFEATELFGLNIDSRQLDRARRGIRARAQNQLTFVEGDACAMPFENGSFDILIAVESSFHFSSRAGFLAEARRVLKDRGRLVIADFVPSTTLSPLLGLPLFAGQTPLRRVFGAHDVSYTVERYRAEAEQRGFYLDSVQDLTENTLPTHVVLRRVAAEMTGHARLARAAAGAIEWLCRARLLQYVLLDFATSGLTR